MASEDVVVHVIRQFLKEEADQVLMQLLPIEDRSYLIAKLYSVLFTNITEYDRHTYHDNTINKSRSLYNKGRVFVIKTCMRRNSRD